MTAPLSSSAPGPALLIPYALFPRALAEATCTLKPICCGRCATTDTENLIATHKFASYTPVTSLGDYHWTCQSCLDNEVKRCQEDPQIVSPEDPEDGVTVSFNCCRCAALLNAAIQTIRERTLRLPSPIEERGTGPSPRASSCSGVSISSAHRAYMNGAPIPESMLGEGF